MRRSSARKPGALFLSTQWDECAGVNRRNSQGNLLEKQAVCV